MAWEDDLSRTIKSSMIFPDIIQVRDGRWVWFLFVRYLNLEIDNIFPRCLMISDQLVKELAWSKLFDDLSK